MKYIQLNDEQRMTVTQRLCQATLGTDTIFRALTWNNTMLKVYITYSKAATPSKFYTEEVDMNDEVPVNLLVPLVENEQWQIRCDDPHCCPPELK